MKERTATPRPGAETLSDHPALPGAVGDLGPVRGVLRLLGAIVSVVSGGIFHLRIRSGGVGATGLSFGSMDGAAGAGRNGQAPATSV